MADMFGNLWEREHGRVGGDKFYIWAEKIEPMDGAVIKSKLVELERRFVRSVEAGKDVIYPPTLIYFLALRSTVSNPAHKLFKLEKPKHTKEELAEIAERGLVKLRRSLK